MGPEVSNGVEASGRKEHQQLHHDLRHTCASLLINKGVSPKYIQQQLRHDSIQTTFDRYGHLFPETNEEVARVLDDAISDSDTVPSNGCLTNPPTPTTFRAGLREFKGSRGFAIWGRSPAGSHRRATVLHGGSRGGSKRCQTNR